MYSKCHARQSTRTSTHFTHMENIDTKQNHKPRAKHTSLVGLFLDACGLCICTYKFCNCLIILLFYDTIYVCKDELPMYVFMYLFFQYLHRGLSAGLWWKKQTKTYRCHWNFYFLLFDTVLCYILLL